MALNDNALCDVSLFEKWLDAGPIDDPEKRLIAEIHINTASNAIERFCRRQFKRATLTDEAYDGNDSAMIRVRRPPLVALTAIKIVGDAGTTDISASTNSFKWDDKGYITLVSSVGLVPARFPLGRQNVLLSYTGGYDVTPPEVQLAALYAVAHHWYGSAGDPSARSRSGGGATTVRVIEPWGLPADAIALLRPFRIPLTRTIVSRNR